MSTDYQERAREYAEGYEGGEPREINNLFVATGDWIERLAWSTAAADAAMKALYAEVVFGGREDVEANPSASWRDLWRDGVQRHWDSRILEVTIDLHSFAFYGLRPSLHLMEVQDGEGLAEAIESTVGKMRAILDAAPASWVDLSDVENTIAAAEARIRLDNGRNVTVEQLAALAGVGVKSLKNILGAKGGAGDLKVDDKGQITRSTALVWLSSRPKFKSSLWMEADISTDNNGHTALEQALGNVVFVPAAKDGSWFDPETCRTPRGEYVIGTKGAEIHVGDYWTALEQLARMPTPRWRRPNAAGGWGLVSGTTWQRREESELSRLVSPYARSAHA